MVVNEIHGNVLMRMLSVTYNTQAELYIFIAPIAMLLARFTCNFKCDKVRVIVAWGKNCREESDIVFAIGYHVCKGTFRVPTVIQLT